MLHSNLLHSNAPPCGATQELSSGHLKAKPSSGHNPGICDMRQICARQPSQLEATLNIKPRCPKHHFFTPSQSECSFLHLASSSEAGRLHTPPSQNATCYIKHLAPRHDFFTPLSIIIQLLHQASSSEARLFHTPLNQNASFYIKPRAPKHDFFIPLSVRMPLFTSSLELRSLTFSHPSRSECNFLHQASSFET